MLTDRSTFVEGNSVDFFNICVKILEATDLPHPNMSSYACVDVGGVEKCTKTVQHTDRPYFNEYFVFDLHTDFNSMVDTKVTLSLSQPKKVYRLRSLIGCVVLELGTVWSLEDHTMRRWFVVSLPKDPTAQTKGFINCEIKIEAGEKYGLTAQLRRWTMPEVLGGARARYIIKIYNCIGLQVNSTLEESKPDVHVVVAFAGKTEVTSRYKLKEKVEWNEQIMFIELFPPMFQNVTIRLLINDQVIASKAFYLTEMCFPSKDFFLPKFGPTYIHLYGKSFSYLGSLLIEIDTEVITLFKFKEKLHACLKSMISAPPSSKMDKLEKFLLYGVIFDVVLLNQAIHYDSLSLSLTFGNVGRFPLDPDENHTNTDTYKVKKEDLKDCFYLEIEEDKPCVFAHLECLDTRHRLSNSNMIARLAQDLREGTEHAQNCISRASVKEALRTMKMVLKQAKQDAKIIPELLSVSKGELDIQRVMYLTSQMKRIIKINTRGKDIDFLFDKANLMLSILNEISVDIQDSLPFVFISLKQKETLLGMCRVQPKDIIFSSTKTKRGINCGRINSLFIKSNDEKTIGKLDVWLWLGLWDHVSTCLQSLPSGHEDIQKAVDLPLTIRYVKPEMYLGACHLFGGHLSEVGVNEGLCNSFVRVFISCHGRETNTFRKSLAPMWKETLLFTNLKLCPSPEYIQKNPPMMTVEIWDSSLSPAVLLGSGFVEPKVRLLPISGKVEYSLEWTKLGESKILAAFEIVQLTDENEKLDPSRPHALSLVKPKFLDPVMISYRLEVVFWGLRPSGVNPLKDIFQPQIVMNCSFSEISSNVLNSANQSLNFKHNLQAVKVELPETKIYTPPLVLRLTVSGKPFGSKAVANIHQYSCKLPTQNQWKNMTTRRKSIIELAKSRHHTINESVPDLIPLINKDAAKRYSEVQGRQFSFKKFITFFTDTCSAMTKPFGKLKQESSFILQEIESEEEYDWWYKYYSKEVTKYNQPLEKEKLFEGFTDVLKTFTVTKNNTKARIENSVKIKLMVCLYKWPVEKQIVNTQGQDVTMGAGVLVHTDMSDRVKLLVRVYCLQAHHLHPADFNGSADPFVEIATQSQCVSDKTNFLSRQLNPMFGRCLELSAELPKDANLAVRVMDYDRISKNDCIGETIIDLENRFYSKHRATCGLPKMYSQSGYNKWRDVEKPTQILERLCNSYNLPLPEYYEKSVVIASKEFVADKKITDKEDLKEKLALNALHRWQEVPFVGTALVPEHVEKRPLYSKNKPGIVQGRLDMWVDIFDLSLGEVPPPVDITKRLPQRYELRMIVWNTAKVPLVDNSFFVGKRHTDILVKAWLYDHKTVQSTDVHFTSTNGEGNFNWRFIFPIDYYAQEGKMVVYEKRVFDMEKSERKVPPLLHIQVWDNDKLSPNDFIGSTVLELNKMPRGASSAKKCKIINNLSSENNVNLFKVKHLKGWWAFTRIKEKTKSAKPVLGGLLEAEFDLVTADEAVMSPVGLGRDDPAALPPPDRPEIRARFWLAPFRILLHLICGVHKGKVFLCLLTAALVVFALIAIYSIPLFIIKKIIGA